MLRNLVLRFFDIKGIGVYEKIISGFFRLCGLLSIIILFGIFLLLFINASQFFTEYSITEIFNDTWQPKAYEEKNISYGVFGMLVGTGLVVIVAMIIAIPIGVLTAVYLAYLAPYWLAEILKPIIEFIAAIPSVVVGFFGVVLIAPLISDFAGYFGIESDGLNALNGGILLAMMSLPTIISITEDSLQTVPKIYIEGSYALSASKPQTIIRVCIPAALSGIVAAIMLGLGRAIGETMTVLMVAGNSLEMPSSIMDSVRTLTATLAMEMGDVPAQTPHFYGLFMLGLVLFVITFIVNLISELLMQRFQEVDRP